MESHVEPVVSTLESPYVAGDRGVALEPRLAARLLAGALAIGFLTQLLFFGQGFGVNVLLGTATLLTGAALARRPGSSVDRWDLWLPPAALVFASFVALRADPALVAFDIPAALGLTGASAAALAGFAVTRRTLTGIIVLGLNALGATVAGSARLGPGLTVWSAAPARMHGSRAWPVVLGSLIALPFVVVFAALFASADPVFGRLLDLLLGWQIDLGDLPLRLAVALLGAWLAGGLLLFVATRGGPGPDSDAPTDARPEAAFRRLDPSVAAVALLLIDALFTVFVLLQAAYLFGGRDTLEAVGLTYSQYARRGFFELIGVAIVAGSLVLFFEALLVRRSRVYVAAAVAMTLLTSVVLLSATVRLALYQQAYGWTELRFYALAAIGWLCFGVVAAVTALVADRMRWLLHGLIIGGLVVALGVNLIGPQAFVAGANVERALHPELVPPDGEASLDAAYLGLLADDAVPVLLDALPRLPPAEGERIRAQLAARLSMLASDPTMRSWPSFNVARQRALRALEASRGQLAP